jgi:hypothetical protein
LFTFLCLERRFERVSLIGGASWYLKPSDFTAGQVGQLGVPQPGQIFGEPALTHIEQGESPSDQTFGKDLLIRTSRRGFEHWNFFTRVFCLRLLPHV